MEEMTVKIKMMVEDAEKSEKTIMAKIEKMKASTFSADKLTKLIIEYQCALERCRTLYEVRGKLGI